MNTKHATLLVLLLGGAVPAAASLAERAPRTAPHSGGTGDFEIETVRDDLFVVRGGGGNAVVRTGRSGLVVVDAKGLGAGRALREQAAALARAASKREEIAALILTHHQADTAGGRVGFGDTLVLASDAAAERLRGGAGGGGPSSFSTRFTLRLDDGEVVTCHHKGAAHTDGDVVVHFAEARVLVVGGLVANGLHPAVVPDDGADVRGWIRVLKGLRRDFRGDRGLRVVPGDGPTGGLELLDAQIDYLQRIVDLVDDALRRGQSLAELLRRAGPLRDAFDDVGGDSSHFERTLRALYEEG